MVAMVYGIPESAISCYLVFFVMKPDAAESSILAIALSFLVAIVVVVLLVLTNLTLTMPSMRIATLAVSSMLLLFLASASKLGPLGGIIALVLAFAMTLLSDVPFGEAATRGILYAWLMATMPMGLVLLVSVTIGRRPLQLLRDTVGGRMQAIACLLEGGDHARRVLHEMVAEGQAEPMKRLGMLKALALAGRAETRRLGIALQESYRMVFAVLEFSDKEPSSVKHELAAQAREVGRALAAGQMPPSVVVPQQASEVASRVWSALSAVCSQSPAKPVAQPAEPFLSSDAFTNPDHMRYALKTTLAALICYLIYTALDWQDIHTAMITCYVAALGSVAETTQKLLLRIIGCLVGAAMGVASILFVIPHMSTIGGLVVLVFAGSFLAAWVAVGSERISYAGVQIALAFLMTLLQGFGPDIDMSVAMDRVIGILLGNFVLYAVFTLIWPVSVGRRVRNELGHAIGDLAQMARVGDEGRDAMVAQAGSIAKRLAGAREALRLARLEPRGIRLDRHHFRSLIAITQSIQALCARLLVETSIPDERLAARLETLAQALKTESFYPTWRAASTFERGSVGHLSQLIGGR
ncbi:hypothetical protein ASD71_03985 [Achromobacter sp. Root565]|nr:hypothetical protein ASD71_03985 [Achromobacter sp. Root565]